MPYFHWFSFQRMLESTPPRDCWVCPPLPDVTSPSMTSKAFVTASNSAPSVTNSSPGHWWASLPKRTPSPSSSDYGCDVVPTILQNRDLHTAARTSKVKTWPVVILILKGPGSDLIIRDGTQEVHTSCLFSLPFLSIKFVLVLEGPTQRLHDPDFGGVGQEEGTGVRVLSVGPALSFHMVISCLSYGTKGGTKYNGPWAAFNVGCDTFQFEIWTICKRSIRQSP